MSQKGQFKHVFPATTKDTARTLAPPNGKKTVMPVRMAEIGSYPAHCRVNGIQFVTLLSFQDERLARLILQEAFVSWPAPRWEGEDAHDYKMQPSLKKRQTELEWQARGHDLKDLEILTKPTEKTLKQQLRGKPLLRSTISL